MYLEIIILKWNKPNRKGWKSHDITYVGHKPKSNKWTGQRETYEHGLVVTRREGEEKGKNKKSKMLKNIYI